MKWKPINGEKPESEQLVYVSHYHVLNDGRKIQRQSLAHYIPPMTVNEDDFMDPDHAGDGDYDEVNDIYYVKPGFYEYQYEAEIAYLICNTVTHWHPLFIHPVLTEQFD